MSETTTLEPKLFSLDLPEFNDCFGPDLEGDGPFDDLPYVPFSKSETINYIANWESKQIKYSSRKGPGIGDQDADLFWNVSDTIVDGVKDAGDFISLSRRSYDTRNQRNSYVL